MAIDPRDLNALRTPLLRFAHLQLRNTSLAEDAVSETILAVMEHPDRFHQQSSLKTYVIGILKHKLIDQLRRGKREMRLTDDPYDERSDAAMVEALFDSKDHAIGVQPDWGDPVQTLERKEFFDVLQLCIDKLPAKTGRIFMMREWLEMDTDAICKELDITSANAWVMLYRARTRLRECLQISWFAQVPS
ncbi:sigma-70 family RNA polymerase sigma factor [Glaciimonas immobilis]|uniref:RNA polymerase sigma-70 factor (ECF subfamily) n=1 Tax=Glaciimonas immobilis TaxID=728004 RepID=A0A840RTG3_9BURK|nr:sigma-70 family RNA polymerase sigma factor [Glaciimonas immobilis]KAF3999949.1 sigma-70 family RNA polymerase sigma factor [Glaciimonas immobilis]MBB5200452.1 RNA polymerase sigma-70 factor (ECF subfamily) [Glaciimonas immobilis]